MVIEEARKTLFTMMRRPRNHERKTTPYSIVAPSTNSRSPEPMIMLTSHDMTRTTYRRNDRSEYKRLGRQGARSLVEALLLALEVTKAAAIVVGTATAATTITTAPSTTATIAEATTASSTTTATSSTVAKASTASSTTTAAAATKAATGVLNARSSVVNADGTTFNILAIQSLKSSGSLLSGGEVDIPKAFQCASVAVGRKGNTSDGAVLSKDLLDGIVGAVEREVAKKERIGWSAALVSVLIGAIVTSRLVTRSAEIDVQFTAIKLILVHLGLRLDSIINVGEFDVPEALGATTFTVGDDTAASDLSELLELTTEPIFIDVPA
jgi:hypothetical protein